MEVPPRVLSYWSGRFGKSAGPNGPSHGGHRALPVTDPAAEYCGMTVSTSIPESGSRRHPVRLDRVDCWRLGPGELERCRECVYLLGLEHATAHGSTASQVVCVDDNRDLEAPFSW